MRLHPKGVRLGCFARREDHHDIPGSMEGKLDRAYRLGIAEKARDDEVYNKWRVQDGLNGHHGPIKVEETYKGARPIKVRPGNDFTRQFFSGNGSGEGLKLLSGAKLRRAEREAAFERKVKMFGRR